MSAVPFPDHIFVHLKPRSLAGFRVQRPSIPVILPSGHHTRVVANIRIRERSAGETSVRGGENTRGARTYTLFTGEASAFASAIAVRLAVRSLGPVPFDPVSFLAPAILKFGFVLLLFTHP